MKQRVMAYTVLALAALLAASTGLLAQSQPAASPTAQSPAPKTADPNAFPEDTSSVPVVPTSATPAGSQGADPGSGQGAGLGSDDLTRPATPLPLADRDPARTPDDPLADQANQTAGESSSSLQGLERLLPNPDDDRKAKKEQVHVETASEDLDVGKYYLEAKNWKAALSRFESALVLAPDEPEVYWGLGEAERHLGEYVKARHYYEQLLQYDPDGPHTKEIKKLLKEPELESARGPLGGTSAPAQPVTGAPK